MDLQQQMRVAEKQQAAGTEKAQREILVLRLSLSKVGPSSYHPHPSMGSARLRVPTETFENGSQLGATDAFPPYGWVPLILRFGDANALATAILGGSLPAWAVPACLQIQRRLPFQRHPGLVSPTFPLWSDQSRALCLP